jgi:hypothetical protein
MIYKTSLTLDKTNAKENGHRKADEEKALLCPVHGVPMKRWDLDDQTILSHKNPDGSVHLYAK